MKKSHRWSSRGSKRLAILASVGCSYAVGCSGTENQSSPAAVSGGNTSARGTSAPTGGQSSNGGQATARGSSNNAGGAISTGGTGGTGAFGGTTARPASGGSAAGGMALGGSSTRPATTAGGVTSAGGRISSGILGGMGGLSSNPPQSTTGGVRASNPAGGTMTSGGTVSTGGTYAQAGSSDMSASVPPSVDKPSTDTNWSQNLTVGPNGPIPLIVVDQFGYRTSSKKVAVIRDPQTGYDNAVSFAPGSNYSVVDKATGKAVKQGTPAAWNSGVTDSSSGDKVWWFDFSDVTAPGTYTVVDADKNVRSVEFDIDDNVYRSVLKHAVRMYYYQRAGFAKSAATVGNDWADAASHLGAGQDGEAHAWTAKTDSSLVRDLRGGWYDAGDYNKYTAWAAGTAIALLHAYDENPAAFGDDYGIAESGNGTPDILDEIKWALDWIVRMQSSDGSLLCVLGLASGSPPSAATGPSYYGPATTNATLMGAAVFAYAAKIYGARPESSWKAFANDLSSRALKAWTWASANPNVIYHNNDESKQPGSSGLAAGNQETDDNGRLTSKFQAAVHLYALTGEANYRTFAETNWTQVLVASGPTEWDMERADAVVYFARLSGVTPSTSTAIVNQVTANVKSQLAATAASSKDPYRAHLTNYTWSSNQIKMAQARLFQYLAKLDSGTNADQGIAAAEDYVHYLHGVNPLGLVYLTNMKRAGSENSAKTMFHTWFADGNAKWDEVSNTTPGPAPGFLVGGPNPSFSLDSCCTATTGDAYHCYGAAEYSLCSQNWQPPLGQPTQKAYLQFNSGWPAGSWSITEPSTGYQAKYILVLSAYAH